MTGKERLIELLKLLYAKTDDDHPMSTAQIVAYFEDQGVVTSRLTVKADVETLNNCGIEIYSAKGTQTKYHLVDRQLELAELKLLVDAVESSKFITAKKSDALVPRHGGEPYIFSPYAMLYNEDKYYVVGFDRSKCKVVTYRVDRMKSAEILAEPIYPRPNGFDPVDYTVNIFSLYDGKIYKVNLLCENRLMNYVIDRFGEDVDTIIMDEAHFRATVKVSVSQTFFAWVFQFAGGIRITSPASVKDQYRQMLEKAQI